MNPERGVCWKVRGLGPFTSFSTIMNILTCNCLSRFHGVGLFLIRIVIGAIFAVHGYQKLTEMGVDGTAGFLAQLGFPMASVFAVLLIAAELGGGLLLIAGAFTHWVAKILTIVAAVALLTVHITKGFMVSSGGYEYILLILVCCIALTIAGPGRWSVDGMMKKPMAQG